MQLFPKTAARLSPLLHLDGFTSLDTLAVTTSWMNDWNLFSSPTTSLPSRILGLRVVWLHIQIKSPTCTSRQMHPNARIPFTFSTNHLLGTPTPVKQQSLAGMSSKPILLGLSPDLPSPCCSHACSSLITGPQSHSYSLHLTQSSQDSVGHGSTSGLTSLTSWFIWKFCLNNDKFFIQLFF